MSGAVTDIVTGLVTAIISGGTVVAVAAREPGTSAAPEGGLLRYQVRSDRAGRDAPALAVAARGSRGSMSTRCLTSEASSMNSAAGSRCVL